MGVGTGAEILSLSSAYPEWTFVGMDSSVSMLDVCRARLETLTLQPLFTLILIAWLHDYCSKNVELDHGLLMDKDRKTPSCLVVLFSGGRITAGWGSGKTGVQVDEGYTLSRFSLNI